MPRTTSFAGWASLDGQARRAAAAAAVERARRLEPRLHAYVTLGVSASAATAGPLAGMPYGAKDIFATTQRQPTCGLDRGVDIGPSGDAEVLHRLDQYGAVRFGFCSMTGLAYEPSGYNASQAQARNPWNVDFITGGSSSGSAVAVASGSAFFALGSDTAGSVRIPAHACGVTAWKPTAGRVSTRGAMALAPTLDTIGILARSASDLAGPAAVFSDEEADLRPAGRVVVLADVLAAAEPAVRRACEDGVGAVAAAGLKIDRRDAGALIKAIDAEALVVLQGEPPRIHHALLDDASLDPTLRKRLVKGLTVDDAALAASRSARAPLSERFLEKVLGDADAALLPVMPICTPRCEVCNPSSPKFDARTLYRLSEWTRFVNMLGFPAVAMPVGFDDNGLPIALQIVGRPGADLALIALTEAAQKLTDWHGRVPTAVADLVADAELLQ
jgi:aspartyl-tRNA(Asn)/glutamyl-tRNA(Gln) amidotransferase subunit A